MDWRRRTKSPRDCIIYRVCVMRWTRGGKDDCSVHGTKERVDRSRQWGIEGKACVSHHPRPAQLALFCNNCIASSARPPRW